MSKNHSPETKNMGALLDPQDWQGPRVQESAFGDTQRDLDRGLRDQLAWKRFTNTVPLVTREGSPITGEVVRPLEPPTPHQK